MLLFTEGWDWSTTTGNYTSLGRWTGAGGSINTTNQRFASGGNSFNDTNHNTRWDRAIGQNLASGVIGFAFRIDSGTTPTGALCLLCDGAPASGTVQCGIILNSDYTISVIRTNSTNVLGTTSYTVPTNTWVYIEFKWKINDSISAHDVQVYVDGSLKLDIAAASDTKNTANAYATHYCLMGNLGVTGSSGKYYFDDHYLMDLTGSVNNAPIGSVRIQTLFPNGNGNSSMCVGSDGNSVNNYLLVNETGYNSANYVDGASLNDKDTYTFDDTISSTSTIYGLTTNMNALKTDAGARSVNPVVRHSGTDYDGTSVALTTSAAFYQQVYETNPGTSSGWTKSDIDAAEFGMKVSV